MTDVKEDFIKDRRQPSVSYALQKMNLRSNVEEARRSLMETRQGKLDLLRARSRNNPEGRQKGEEEGVLAGKQLGGEEGRRMENPQHPPKGWSARGKLSIESAYPNLRLIVSARTVSVISPDDPEAMAP